MERTFAIAIVKDAVDKLYSKNLSKDLFLEEIRNKLPKYINNAEQFLNSKEDLTVTLVADLLGTVAIIISSNKDKVITPWIIEKAKVGSNLFRFLGPARTKLPILVLVNIDDKINSYTHNLSQDFVFGLITSLDSNNLRLKDGRKIDFSFHYGEIFNKDDINRSRINYSSIEDYYKTPNYRNKTEKKKIKITKKYVAVLQLYGSRASFDTIDLIQGVVTAASWTDRNPHDLIYDIEDRGVPVTF